MVPRCVLAGYPLKLKKWDPGDRDGCHPHWVRPDGADAPRCRYKIPLVCQPPESANAACLTLLCQGPYPPMQRVRACESRLVPVRMEKAENDSGCGDRQRSHAVCRYFLWPYELLRCVSSLLFLPRSKPRYEHAKSARHSHANARHKHADPRHEHATPRQ